MSTLNMPDEIRYTTKKYCNQFSIAVRHVSVARVEIGMHRVNYGGNVDFGNNISTLSSYS